MHLARNQKPEFIPSARLYWEMQVYLTVSAENPIFYQHQGEIEASRGNLRQAERQCDLLSAKLLPMLPLHIMKSLLRALTSFVSEKLAADSSQVASVARRGYEYGATDLATAIVAQQQYQQTSRTISMLSLLIRPPGPTGESCRRAVAFVSC